MASLTYLRVKIDEVNHRLWVHRMLKSDDTVFKQTVDIPIDKSLSILENDAQSEEITLEYPLKDGFNLFYNTEDSFIDASETPIATIMDYQTLLLHLRTAINNAP